MNYLIFQFNKFRQDPDRMILAVCLALVVLTLLFLQISSCRVEQFVYYSGRLHGKPGLMCRIF